MNKEKTGCIYIHTNIISGKSYIGLTTLTVKKRWQSHIAKAKKDTTNSHFHKAIRKYGEDSWVTKVLEADILYVNMNGREIFWIEKYNTYKTGYNLTPGGDSTPGIFCAKPWTEERRARQMATLKERGPISMTDEQKQKLREANLGKKQSAETKAKRIKSLQGIKAGSFKLWWYMRPEGIFVCMDDMTKKDFSLSMGWNPRALGDPKQCAHGRVITQGPRKGWAFGNGEL